MLTSASVTLKTICTVDGGILDVIIVTSMVSIRQKAVKEVRHLSIGEVYLKIGMESNTLK